ncbi:MAG TPA: hypothetical protein VG934_00285 [Candidatus Paceibacterota bacterium]|nr:hypothetical protein [Candidatus Paceibacterota bacterium]
METRTVTIWKFELDRSDIRHVVTVMQWVLVAACLLWALWELNATPFLIAIVGAVWFVAAMILSETSIRGKRMFHITEQDRRQRRYGKVPSDAFFPNLFEYWAAAGWPVVAIVASSFYFLPMSQTCWEYHVIDRGNGDIVYENGWSWPPVFFNPFTAKLRNFGAIQAIDFYDRDGDGGTICSGQTADHVPIQAQAGARLVVSPSEESVAYLRVGSNGELYKKAGEEMCRSFANVVSTYPLDHLPATYVLERAMAADQQEMNSFGLHYSGTVRLAYIHLDALQ